MFNLHELGILFFCNIELKFCKRFFFVKIQSAIMILLVLANCKLLHTCTKKKGWKSTHILPFIPKFYDISLGHPFLLKLQSILITYMQGWRKVQKYGWARSNICKVLFKELVILLCLERSVGAETTQSRSKQRTDERVLILTLKFLALIKKLVYPP